MWRSEVGLIKKRLLAKITAARHQLSDNDTPIPQLELSLAIISKLIARVDEIKAEASNEAPRRKKSSDYEETPITEIMELTLDATEVSAELQLKINNKTTPAVPSSSQVTNFRSNNLNVNMKLPKLTMKKFNGEITQFQEFWETFTLAIDQTELDDIQKFIYLKSLLSDDAEKVISGLSTTSDNYNVAKTLLKEKYDNKQRVIQQLYQKLNAVPKATKQTLRQTYDNLEAILRSLEAAKENIEGGALLSIIAKKYPEEILSKVFETNSVLTVSALRNSIKQLTLWKDQVDSFVKPDVSSTVTSTNYTPKFTTDSLLTKAQTSSQKKKLCRYCSKAHWSDECSEYKTIDARKAKIKGSCFICLREGHNLKKCTLKKKCVYCKQEANHHRSLCSQKFGDNAKNQSSEQEKTVTCLSLEKRKTKGRLLTATTIVTNGCREAKTRLIFDNGSLRSYITNDLKNKLKLQPLYNEMLEVSTFGDKKIKVINSQVFELPLQLRDGSVIQIHVNAVPQITSKFKVSIPQLLSDLGFTNNLADDGTDSTSDILIGSDYYFQLVNEERKQVSEQLLLINSKFGWLISGNEVISEKHIVSEEPCLLAVEISNSIKNLWELEAIGVVNINDNEEETALADFYKNISYHDQQYTVKWPWKRFPQDLPTNFELAYGRLKTLIHKMNSASILEYDAIIRNQQKSNIVETTPIESSNTLHYLPHHPVFTPGKSTPQRIVYDGSAKTKKTNKSLNECLFKGKVLLEHSVALLLRFQLHEFVIVADIEKAFLQIGLHPQDRDTTRFLWLKDIHGPVSPANLEIFRFTKIPFGVVSSPFLLSATIHYHLTNSKSKVAAKILQDFYVDNLITGVANLEEGKWLYNETKKIFSEASMNLRNYKSNSTVLNEYFGIDEDLNSTLSILGIIWDSKSDNLQIKPCKQGGAKTKREVLQSTASVFDPLGWFSPIILCAKVFIKELWCQQIDWDQTLTNEEQHQWEIIYTELSKTSEFQLPRLKGKSSEQSAVLHAFVDASKVAYAAVIYLQIEKDTNLIFTKSRVTPQKPVTLTIPRLELLAILIGVRALKFVKNSLASILEIKEIFLWSDSKVALQWIYTNKVLPTFVERRAREIREYIKDIRIQLQYVPSAQNPADLASRGCTYNQLNNSNWWKGPTFLYLNRDEWPQQQQNYENLETEETVPSCLLTTQKDPPVSPYEINIKNFSSLSRLLNTTSTCFKAISIFKAQTYPDAVVRRNYAKIRWLQYEQQLYFDDIFDALKENKFHNLQKQLELWLDPENLLRCKGRLQESEYLTYDEKYPILLSPKGYFTKLLIMYFHTENHDVGTAHTLAALRKFYWIPRGRSVVFNTIKTNCMVCKFFHAKLFEAPPAPPLPEFRITPGRPFKCTGIDVFGPLYVKSFINEDGRQKVWCIIFTCLITRSIHLEILQNMTTEDILLGIRSFIALRQTPTLFLSDNAPQHKLLAEIFEKATSSPLNNFLQEKGITWKFIPALAPWMGGAYERLIGLVKQSLKKSLFKLLLTNRQLQVILMEIASTLNSRPLTYVASEKGTEILTPEKLISSYVEESHPPEINLDKVPPQTTSTAQQLILSWKKSQAAVSHFWEIWRNSYLLSLRERYTKLQQPHRVSQTIPYEGQIVIVAEENLPRSVWRIARIVHLNESQDGKVRSAEIKFPNDVTVVRPIAKLCPLELDNGDLTPTPSASNSDHTPNVDNREEFEIAEIQVEEIDDN